MTEFKVELLPPIDDGTNVRVERQVEDEPGSGIWSVAEVLDIDDFDPTLFLDLRPGNRFIIRQTRWS